MCDDSDADIVVKGPTDIWGAPGNKNDKAEKEVAFKNNLPFRSCISRIKQHIL